MKENAILIRRRNKILIDTLEVLSEPKMENIQTTYTGLIQLYQLGYTFSSDVIGILNRVDQEICVSIIKETLETCQKLIGADVDYHFMYPGFPEEVMQMDDLELVFNAIMHYGSDGTWLPVNELPCLKRDGLFEETERTVLNLGTEKEFDEIFINLISSNTSLFPQDREDIQWYFENEPFDRIMAITPEVIPFKETMAFVMSLIIKRNEEEAAKFIGTYAKTATDILRLLVTLSEGDSSLAEKVTFKNFPRKERRIYLAALNQCSSVLEDMKRHETLWIRLGERLHPGEYKKKYPRIYECFRKLRSGERIVTYNSRLQECMDKADYTEALNLLIERPGEFARRLDDMLCKTDAEGNIAVVNEFKKVASTVSSRVLLQVIAHFNDRLKGMEYRMFTPKGRLEKTQFAKAKEKELNADLIVMLIQFCKNALIQRYSQMDLMGKVYIDPALKRYKAPMSQRSASKTLKTVGRGSRIPIDPNATTVRGFIWWTNTENDRVDLDLSASFYKEDWTYLTHISYTRLKNGELQAYHSGDIVNGGPVDGVGTSEFLDIDIESALAKGARYVVYSVHSYTGQYFGSLPNCRFGWMEREKPNSGEVYEPTTVKQNMDIVTNSTNIIPMVFDLETKEAIWMDMPAMSGGALNTIENLQTRFSIMGKAMANSNTSSLYDLAKLHAQARGLHVGFKEDADLILDEEKATQTDYWQSLI